MLLPCLFILLALLSLIMGLQLCSIFLPWKLPLCFSSTCSFCMKFNPAVNGARGIFFFGGRKSLSCYFFNYFLTYAYNSFPIRMCLSLRYETDLWHHYLALQNHALSKASLCVRKGGRIERTETKKKWKRGDNKEVMLSELCYVSHLSPFSPCSSLS